MEKIRISDEAIYFLEELVINLYKKEYFSYLLSSEEYVLNIYNFIYSIDTLKKKATKRNKYGNWYCKYKHSNKTSWYITFDVEDGFYFVTHITNNHTADYPKYIRGY